MAYCKFCDTYNKLRKMHQKRDNDTRNDPDSKIEIKHGYMVQLHYSTLARENAKSKYHSFGSIALNGTYPVKFCPVCGKKVQRCF